MYVYYLTYPFMLMFEMYLCLANILFLSVFAVFLPK